MTLNDIDDPKRLWTFNIGSFSDFFDFSAAGHAHFRSMGLNWDEMAGEWR